MARQTETRFVVITHNDHHGADGPPLRRHHGQAGVSQLVSVDLQSAERILEVA